MNEGAATIAAGELVDGRYEIVGPIGSGAMGQVYEARTPDGRPCAIKTLRYLATEANGREMMVRFSREARLTRRLRSRNIVPVEDSGYDDAHHVPFIVMGLLRGCDLERLVERVGPLRPELAVRIVLEAGAGLAEAHAEGVVHRDVKPSNLFLHEHGADEIVVKVCDFGIAKVVGSDESLTASGSLLGTPLYMAPEQVRDAKHVDTLADVWSLAMTLDFALAGEAALARSRNLPELMAAVMRGEVSLVNERAPWVDPALAAVVRSALRAEREQRCPSIAAWMERLRPFAGSRGAITRRELVGGPPELSTRSGPASGDADTISACQATIDATPSDPFLGATLAGRYRVERLLGRGGMGAVYEAVNETGLRVAVKLLLGDAKRHPDLARRFVRESRMLTAIRSPYVVRVLDADTDDERGLPFLVMELLRGRTLAATTRAAGALEPGPIVRLFVQAGAGLAEAHARGIVHRDIKPSNLLLHELDDGEVVMKICDFGVAKLTHVGETDETTVELTHTGGVLGSPVYMSPEQAQNAKTVDVRTDVWSLGISLWEALAGQRPWAGCTSVGELIVAICTRDLRPLGELAPWLDPGLVAAVERALRREPAERYADVSAFAAALEPFASPAPPRRDELVGVRDTSPRAAHARPVVGSVPPRARTSSTRSRLFAPLGVAAALAVGAAALAVRSQTGAPSPAGSAVPPVQAPLTAPAPAVAPTASEVETVPAATAVASAAGAKLDGGPLPRGDAGRPLRAATQSAPAATKGGDATSAGTRAPASTHETPPRVDSQPAAERNPGSGPAPVLTW